MLHLAAGLALLSVLVSSPPRAAPPPESAGDISSVFNSLLGDSYKYDDSYATLKSMLREGLPDAVLQDAWSRLNRSLEVSLATVEREVAAFLPEDNGRWRGGGQRGRAAVGAVLRGRGRAPRCGAGRCGARLEAQRGGLRQGQPHAHRLPDG